MHDMMMPASSFHHHDGSLPLSGSGEQSSDSRRPRVYFADFNKIEFVEDKKDNVQQRLPNNSVSRRHRHRLIKKSSSMNASIQQPQTVENFSRSLSRQQYVLPGQEFNVKKQQLNTSTRTQPVHATIFPDISNTSLPRDAVLNDNASGKNVLTGDKTLSRLRKVAIDLPINISLDVSRDHKRPKRAHSSSVRDAHNQAQLSELADQEAGAGAPRRSSIVSSSFNNRHRPTNRTVPLRQQFISPFKTDSNQYQSQQSHYPNSSSINVRRSASLKHVNARLQDDLEDVSIDEPLSINNRSIATRTESAKVLKRGHVVHFNSKTSLSTPAATETHEMHRQPSRATTRKSSQERFQNLLTIVRPPYITGSHGSSSMPVIDFATSNGNSTNPTPSGIGRSIRRTSAQGPLVFHITSNTIVV